jgi:hypothetical protein
MAARPQRTPGAALAENGLERYAIKRTAIAPMSRTGLINGLSWVFDGAGPALKAPENISPA